MEKMTQSWTEKYRPKRLKNVAAQGRALKDVKKWAKNWEEGNPEKKALLFYGPPGTGKSATAHALAKEMDWDLIEMNASNKRTKKEIEKVGGSAASMGTLTGTDQKRLIVLDEADNVHGNFDRGGYSAISKLVDETNNPVIMIGNDRYDIPKGVKRKVKEVNFRRLRQSSIAKALRQIAKNEGIDADEEVLQKIGDRANGDLRSAINDFQAIAEAKDKVKLEDLSTQDRDRTYDIFKVLGKIKKSRDAEEVRRVLMNFEDSPEDVIDWIEENLPKIMGNIPDLADGYDKLARADIFLGRTRRKQDYHYWRYATDLMSAGVALSRKGKPGKGRFGYPSSRKMYGRSKKQRSIRESLAEKISKNYHVSKKKAVSEFLPYLSIVFSKSKETAGEITDELELEDEETNYLKEFR